MAKTKPKTKPKTKAQLREELARVQAELDCRPLVNPRVVDAIRRRKAAERLQESRPGLFQK